MQVGDARMRGGKGLVAAGEQWANTCEKNRKGGSGGESDAGGLCGAPKPWEATTI